MGRCFGIEVALEYQLRRARTKVTMAINHDSNHKIMFSHPKMVHDLLVEFVSVIRPGALSLDTLQRVNGSYTTETGTARHEDVVWRVRLADRWLYVYLLLEFQSRPDAWMALRMHVYIGLLLQDLERQGQHSNDGKLPPVLPIVLYNGGSTWSAATDIADLIAGVPPWLQALQPAQRYLLIDERAYPPERLDSKTNLVAALFRLELSRTAQDMERVLLSLADWLADPKYASLRHDFSRFASWQLRRKLKDRTIPEMTDLLEVRNMLDERRLDSWWEVWKHEGILEGKREGIVEGKREGIREGEARLLRRLLESRFGRLPAWVDDRLSKATETELVGWGAQLLDPALSLEQLLGS
jgi:hypothetical protein